MKTTIRLTKEDAIRQAKINCIREFENEFDLSVSDESFISNEQIWLKRNTSAKCVCGETAAVELVLFTKFMSTELLENGTVDKDLQYTSRVGFCENCGEE